METGDARIDSGERWAVWSGGLIVSMIEAAKPEGVGRCADLRTLNYDLVE